MESDRSDPAARPRSRSPGTGTAATNMPSRPNRSMPACDRCRKFKKKCSRTLPVCSLCASAGQKCSFSTPPTTSAQTHQLRARVIWLEKFIADKVPGGLPDSQSLADAPEHDGSLTDTSPGTQPNNHDATSQSSGADPDRRIQTTVDMSMGSVMDGPPNGRLSIATDQSPVADGPLTSTSHSGGLPSDAVARKFVDAYLRNVNRAYPFVDHRKLQESLESLDDLSRYQRKAESTLLYLVMAIGCTTLQRAGQIPPDSASRFHISYSDIIQECVCIQSVESIQILLLLALYSLFDPFAPSAFTIVGILSRQAMVLGLTRRASDDKNLTASEVELRHRLTWSIYILDRMLCTSLGLPPALLDENMSTPLPGLTIEEFASPDRGQLTMILQTSRHVVQLRQLEGRILEEIHCKRPSVTVLLSHSDRRVILQQIRTDIENWYSNGCLVSPTESDNVPIHNSMTWLTARYYYLLVLLYYPCHFNPVGLIVPRTELIRYCQKHLQSTAALFHHRQLPLNTVTLYRLFPVIMLLMHLFLSSPADCMPFPEDETVTVVAILEAFPEVWTLARQAAQITQRFLDSVRAISSYSSSISQYPSHGNSSFMNTIGAPSRETCLNVVRPHAAAFLALAQDVLGRASCWLLNMVDDKDLADPAAANIAAAAAAVAGNGTTGGSVSTGVGTSSSAGAFTYQDQQDMNQAQGAPDPGLAGLALTDGSFEWGLEMDFL
ncbi:fungal-specific transcription factor domain-containing protein [Microdochium trichocladiopsis]|uniref:Fungal-specific transcription factor domain-containing protein n=1 Tax=Microdochium trichocladiopsis TaxID=1682393 RepID=A0A9P8XWQ2_9PEZI|nr:fungal-specific transcription factor domain-containing protein [Microdochium trichocladiopsis]KAH7021306.1 fungal-specific transcription factor domain-containing protein [Microdochium trichocladiopsis]